MQSAMVAVFGAGSGTSISGVARVSRSASGSGPGGEGTVHLGGDSSLG